MTDRLPEPVEPEIVDAEVVEADETVKLGGMTIVNHFHGSGPQKVVYAEHIDNLVIE